MTVSGESGEVSTNTADSWKERLPEILEGYKPENVWNMDESGCLWKALPGKGMAEKGKACHRGKTSKVSIFLYCFRREGATSSYLEIRQPSLLQRHQLESLTCPIF